MQRTFLMVCLLLLCVPAALAQDATAEASSHIAYGEVVRGTLTTDAPTATYTFSGSRGDIVTITAESDDFDSFVTLKDAAGATLATDDDRAGNLNARIEALALAAAGDYQITVSSYNKTSIGAFTLRLERADSGVRPPATPAPTAAAAEETADPAREPAAGTMAAGDTVEGTLSGGSPSAEYTFEGRAGQMVTITLTSADFDAYLLLRDAGGRTLATNDDGAGETNARIDAFRLPENGTYTIVAGSYTNAETGAYTLALETTAALPTPAATDLPSTPTPTPAQLPAETPEATAEATAEAGNRLTPGQMVAGELAANTPAAYTFDGRAGQLITVTLVSEAFDAFLRLLDESGAELVTDDDSGGSLNAQIALYPLPSDGTYTISAESLDGAGGSYTLIAAEVTPALIEYTQTVRGTLAPETPLAAYRFTGQAGDVVAISAESREFDAYLSLLQPETATLVTDDDSGGSLNPLIGPQTLPATGSYFIAVRSADDRAGAFSLTLLRAELVRAAYGDTLVGEFTPQTPALYYEFEASAGDVIHIQVASGGTLDTTLSLRGPDGGEVAFDDDSGEASDPEINRLVLTESGTYMLLIKLFDRDQTGRVRLTLAREVLASLDSGARRVMLNEKQAQDVLSFSGAAGERVRLEARILDNTASAPTITVTQGETTLTTVTASTVAALALELVIPADGIVNVQVSDAGFARVTLELTLERIGE